MSDEFDYLKTCYTDLKKKAQDADAALHDSFFVELENYTLRRGVRRTSEQTRRTIVQEVGSQTIEKAAKERPGARIDSESVRIYLKERCPLEFAACYKAAIETVAKAGLPGEREKLDRFDWSEE